MLHSDSAAHGRVVAFGPFRFDTDDGLLTQGGEEVSLTPKAAAVLACLVERPGKTVTKERLLQRVWNGTAVTEHSLTQAILLLRRVLDDDPRKPTYIRTVPKKGYRFIALVSEAPPPEAAATNAAGPSPRVGVHGASSRRGWPIRRPGQWAGAALLLAATAIGVAYLVGPPGRTASDTPGLPTRFTVTFPPGESYSRYDLAPDGRSIVYDRARGGVLGGDPELPLYLRRLDRFESEPIPGTEGGNTPFFAPDGDRVGYFLQGPPERIATATLDGSEVRTVAVFDAAVGSGQAEWGNDGYIYSLGQPSPEHERGIYRIPEAGGEPELVIARDEIRPKFETFRNVQPLPDGAGVIFTAYPVSGAADDGQIMVVSPLSGERRILQSGSRASRYLSSGHLAYERGGNMFIRRLDLANLELVGPELATEIRADARTGSPTLFAVANNGTLVYRSLSPITKILSRVDLDGSYEPLPLPTPSDACDSIDVAPDGRSIVARCPDGVTAGGDLYVGDLVTGVMQRRTRGEEVHSLLWAPDARRIIYAAFAADEWSLRSIAADGESPAVVLARDTVRLQADAISPDGRWLVYARRDPDTGSDLWTIPADGSGDPQPLLVRSANDNAADISPDGRWIAYASDIEGLGLRHVYVAPFVEAGEAVKVSTAVGSWPQWRPDGSGLLYMGLAGESISAADHAVDGSFGPPRELVTFDTFRIAQRSPAAFRIAPDGEEFFAAVSERTQHSLRVVVNWLDEVLASLDEGAVVAAR